MTKRFASTSMASLGIVLPITHQNLVKNVNLARTLPSEPSKTSMLLNCAKYNKRRAISLSHAPMVHDCTKAHKNSLPRSRLPPIVGRFSSCLFCNLLYGEVDFSLSTIFLLPFYELIIKSARFYCRGMKHSQFLRLPFCVLRSVVAGVDRGKWRNSRFAKCKH